MTTEVHTMSFATGAENFWGIVGISGTDQANSNPVLIRPDPGYIYLGATSRTIVAADLWGPILTAENPSNATLSLPTLATLGITVPSNGSKQPFFRYQCLGAGGLFINPATGVKIIWNDLDPQYFLPQAGETNTWGPVCTMRYCGIDPVTGNQTWVAS